MCSLNARNAGEVEAKTICCRIVTEMVSSYFCGRALQQDDADGRPLAERVHDSFQEKEREKERMNVKVFFIVDS